MDIGEKVVCICDDWVNAFGKGTAPCLVGIRLTVRERWLVGALRFLSFEELPEDHLFLIDGFKALKELH